MEGLVTPAAAGVGADTQEPHKVEGIGRGPSPREGLVLGDLGADQGYQLLRRSVNFVVDDRHVELRLGGELLARGLQSAFAFLRRLGSQADQTTDQLVPA